MEQKKSTRKKKVYKYKPPKKKINKLDVYVIFSIAVLLIFTVCEKIIHVKTGMTADTLTTCFYATFGGEILSCCLLKIFKIKKEENNNNALPLM